MNDLLATIKAQAQEMAEELAALRRDFHQHPELSHQEERTARVVADYLREFGSGGADRHRRPRGGGGP